MAQDNKDIHETYLEFRKLGVTLSSLITTISTGSIALILSDKFGELINSDFTAKMVLFIASMFLLLSVIISLIGTCMIYWGYRAQARRKMGQADVDPNEFLFRKGEHAAPIALVFFMLGIFLLSIILSIKYFTN